MPAQQNTINMCFYVNYYMNVMSVEQTHTVKTKCNECEYEDSFVAEIDKGLKLGDQCFTRCINPNVCNGMWSTVSEI